MSCSKDEDLFMRCAYRGRFFRAGLGLGDSVGDDLGGWWKLEVKGFTAKNVMILRNFPEWSFVLLGIWRRTPNLDDFNYIQQAL